MKLLPQNGYVREQFVDAHRDVVADGCIALDIDECIVIDILCIEALDELQKMSPPAYELPEILCPERVTAERRKGIDQGEYEPGGIDTVSVLE